MKLSEFKVGDKIRKPDSPDDFYYEILFKAKDGDCLVESSCGHKRIMSKTTLINWCSDWEFYQEPSRNVKRYAYECVYYESQAMAWVRKIFHADEPIHGFKRVPKFDYEVEEEAQDYLPRSGAV